MLCWTSLWWFECHRTGRRRQHPDPPLSPRGGAPDAAPGAAVRPRPEVDGPSMLGGVGMVARSQAGTGGCRPVDGRGGAAHPGGSRGLVGGIWLGGVVGPAEVASRRTGSRPCPDRAAVHGGAGCCLVGELRGSVRHSGCRRPGRRVGGSIVRRAPRVAGGAVDRSMTHREVETLAAHAQTNKGAAAVLTRTHHSGQTGRCHSRCPGRRPALDLCGAPMVRVAGRPVEPEVGRGRCRRRLLEPAGPSLAPPRAPPRRPPTRCARNDRMINPAILQSRN